MSELLPENPEEPDEEVRAKAEENRETQPENSSLQRQISASVQFTGPLPPPISLEHYNRILPGAANRVFSMAEREQEHRHKSNFSITADSYGRAAPQRERSRCAY